MSTSITFTIRGQQEAEAFKQRIRDEATKRGLSISEFVVEAIAEYLRNEKGNHHV